MFLNRFKIRVLKKKNFSFFTFKLTFIKKNIFINLILNNFLCKYRSIGSKKKKTPLSLIFTYFSYLFRKLKKKLYYSLFIFEISGFKSKIRFFLKKLLKNFFFRINLKTGTILFLEKTFLSFNGITQIRKKKKRYRKKKIHGKINWNNIT